MSTQFSPQWFCGNSCIWADRALCVQVHELPQSHCDDNQESSLFSWLPIYYAHLASERFEHFMFCGSLMTTYILYIYILYIYILYIYILYIYIYIHMKYNTKIIHKKYNTCTKKHIFNKLDSIGNKWNIKHQFSQCTYRYINI